MKKIIATVALAILAFAPAAIAEEVAYVAGMTGVVWGGCKKDVSSAFSKLPGVVLDENDKPKITIENGEEAGTQKVTVITDGSEKVTKEAAVESLGEKAKKYVVQTWTKAGAEEEKKESWSFLTN